MHLKVTSFSTFKAIDHTNDVTSFFAKTQIVNLH